MSPEELLHIAHGELVEVEPMVKLPSLCLLEGEYLSCGPLQVIKFPFYVALLLKKSNMCKIRLPSYLRLENLKKVLETENERMDEYSYIHPHLFSLSNDMFENCYNVEDGEACRILVNRIKEIRFKKTMDGVKRLDGRVMNMNNMTAFEFNEVKEFILGVTEIGRYIEEVVVFER